MEELERIEQDNTTTERTHLTWVCNGGDERMRPRGRAMTKGCGYTNYRSTKQDFTKPPKGGIKGVCGVCSRKKNLNSGNILIHESKRAGRRFVELQNWDNGGWQTVVKQ